MLVYGCQGGGAVPKWLLPTLSEVVALSDPTWIRGDEAQDGAIANDSLEFELPEAVRASRRLTGRLALRQVRAEREWAGAIAAINEVLQQAMVQAEAADEALDKLPQDGTETQASSQWGFILSGPSPVISRPEVARHLASWTLAATSIHSPNWMAFRLLPAEHSTLPSEAFSNSVLPVLPGDPLSAEQFCLVLTPWFSAVLVLGETLRAEPAFMFSFAPEVVQRAWEAIRPRVLLMSPHQIHELDEWVERFPPVVPDYRTVMQFSRLMLAHLPDALEEWRSGTEPDPGTTRRTEKGKGAVQASRLKAENTVPAIAAALPHEGAQPAEVLPGKAVSAAYTSLPEASSLDVELVKAIAHEVRTPLTTIRTLTRSLLKRKDLPPDVLRRLGIIDRECSEQIDRFGLIFKAVELETSATHLAAMSLTRTSLTDVLHQSIPRWQQQASQRQMTLDVVLPQRMPTVVSDPTTLDQALTSLIERFTRNLPAGSHIQVEVTPAGNQLKLQLQSQLDTTQAQGTAGYGAKCPKSAAKSLGQMLMFQPETGSLSLNLSVTKNLFQAIGGKLTVKQRPQQGEVMTVYLPLEVGGSSPLDSNKIITI